ncbi:hypothetical protein [Pseudomonas sp. S1_E04]
MNNPAPTLSILISTLQSVELLLLPEDEEVKNATARAILFERNPEDEEDPEYYESVAGPPLELPVKAVSGIKLSSDEESRLKGKTVELCYRITQHESQLETDSTHLKIQLR